MLKIEEVLKQSLVVVSDMEEVKTKVVKQLETEIKNYRTEASDLVRKKNQINYLKHDLNHYQELKQSLDYYIKSIIKYGKTKIN